MSVYAGFDLGGTHLKYGLVNQKGKILFSSKQDTPEKIADLLNLIRSLWEDLKKKQKGEIGSCGFGFPGIFSLQEQKIYQSPNYPELDNFDLIPALSGFIDVPFRVNNDANMAAFGEFRCGAGQGAHSLILLTIGTGIGSGIILEGKLWQGKCGYGGELGHVTVNPEGEKCNCGSLGCLETEASAPKIVRNYRKFKRIDEHITAELIAKRAEKGDQQARRAYSTAGYYLGIGLAIIINLLNPEKIILGGGVMKSGQYLLPSALKEARRRTYQASYDCCRIEKAALGNQAGFIGAALWAKEQTQQ